MAPSAGRGGEERRGLEFAVLAGVVNQERFHHIFTAHAGRQRVGYLMGLSGSQVIDPYVIGCDGTIMIDQETCRGRSFSRKWRIGSSHGVDAFGQWQSVGLPRAHFISFDLRITGMVFCS